MMEQLIGNHVYVSLKNEDETISGLLIHVEEHYVYLQMQESTQMYIVPKQNVRYYVTENLPETRVAADRNIVQPPQQSQELPEEPPQESALSVFINGDFIVKIMVPPTFDFSKYDDNIMKITLGNADVQAILAGRKQKALEYFPGKVYITTVSEEEESVPDFQNNPDVPNTFGMGTSDPTKQFMSGDQMVSMLNNSVRRGNKT